MFVVYLIKLRFKNLDVLFNFRKFEYLYLIGENGEIMFVLNCVMMLSILKMFKFVVCIGK